MTVDKTDPRAEIWTLMHGLTRFSAANAWVRLRCPDHLAGGPLTAEELAARCQAHPPSLARLLRLMASLGHVTLDPENGTYTLTEVGATLREDVPGSMRPGVLVMGEEMSWATMGKMEEIVRTGRSPVIAEHGSLYGYYSTRPDWERTFATFMTSRSVAFARALLDAYDFGGIRTMVDVGGGAGTILAAILKAHPGMRGTLLDLPTVTASSRAYLAEQGVADRCEVVGGDFLAEVPAGADVYLLASVVHNWPDHTAVKILDTVRAAMTENSRLLLLEFLLPDRPTEPHPGFELDLRMLALFGEGHERTREEYSGLLAQAGLKPLRTIDLPIGPGVIEAAL